MEKINKELLKKKGGHWLGAAREWIKCDCGNRGSQVTWGSTDELRVFTVADVESLALEVAYAMQEDMLDKEESEAMKQKIHEALVGDKTNEN
jgi:hypothetical protein